MRTLALSFIVVGLLSTITQAADITIHIDDANYQADLEDFGLQHSYQKLVPDPKSPGIFGSLIPNPETLDQFMNRKITEFIIESGVAAQVNSKVVPLRDQVVATAKAQYVDVATTSKTAISVQPPK